MHPISLACNSMERLCTFIRELMKILQREKYKIVMFCYANESSPLYSVIFYYYRIYCIVILNEMACISCLPVSNHSPEVPR